MKKSYGPFLAFILGLGWCKATPCCNKCFDNFIVIRDNYGVRIFCPKCKNSLTYKPIKDENEDDNDNADVG